MQGCLQFNHVVYVGGPRIPANDLYVGGFRGFQTSIVGPWITHYRGTTSIIIPLPLLAVFLGSIFMYCASPSQRRRKRKKLGLCVRCGYDLRASKERCPECGARFETPKPNADC